MTDDEVDRLFHALADATRRDILRRVLADPELSMSALARDYPISVTAVQKHVGVLAEAGLVTKRRKGREQRIAGHAERIARARQLLDAYEEIWRGRAGRMAALLDDEPEGERR